LYNTKGFVGFPGGSPSGGGQDQGVKIAKDAILHCTSGLMSEDNRLVLSHLHKAIKPLNQLRILEDATVIYRIARAPERRIFYIDVGNLPKMKAEQYLRDMMAKHKNRLIYDAATGEIRDDRKFMTMLEDYWLPRREGGRGTEITTLPGGQNLGEMDDVLYFQKKMYKSLNVPVSRLEPDTGMSLGRTTEINRDEVKFQKFIQRLRMRFSMLFDSALEKQLVLKGHMTPEEYADVRRDIKYDFKQDNYFTELKENEVLTERVNTLALIDPFVGKYFSEDWVKRNVLRMSDDEILELDKAVEADHDQNTEMDAALADPDLGANNVDGKQGPPQ
jgi:polyhydroxyalkanoate synthesis regulator phasin